jgi:hypothetical protein
MNERKQRKSRPTGAMTTKDGLMSLRRALLIGLAIALMTVVVFVSSGASAEQQSSEVIQIIPDETEPTIALPYKTVSAVTGAPVALYRVNFAVQGKTFEEMAEQYLAKNSANLHLLEADLSDLSHRVTRESLSGPVVRYTQDVSGVPVYKAEIAVHINNYDLVTFVTSSYKSTVDIDSVTPTLSRSEATRIAYDYLDIEDVIEAGKTTLYVYQNKGQSRLVFQVRVVSNQPLGDWEVLVDAHSGELVKVADLALVIKGAEANEESTLVDGTGYVFDPDPLTSATALYGDPGFVDGNDAATTQLDGERFLVNLLDIQFSAGMYTLIGPYAEIQDVEGPFYGLFSQASDAFLYDRFENAFEAANTYYHIDSSMRYINETLGITLMPYQYTGGVRFDAHGLNGADNSHYSSGSGAVAFGEGGVDDAEDSDVIHHELGHGLHDWVTSGGLSQVNGLSEGIGDFWAQSYNRSVDSWTASDPQYNWVFRWDGHNPFWPGRTTDYFGHWPDDLVGQIHTDGQIWGTTMMKVWDAIGKTQTDTAHWEGIGMTGSGTDQNQAANAVMQAAIDLGYSVSDLTAMRDIFLDTGYIIPPLPITDFALQADPVDQTVCRPDDAIYSVDVLSLLGFSDTVDLSLSGEPVGTTVDFTPNGAAAPYTSTLTVGSTGSATLGSYDMAITGVSTTATHTITVGLELLDVPEVIDLVSPDDGAEDQPRIITFQWQADSLADTYTLVVAKDPGLSQIVLTSSGLTGTSYTNTAPLDPDTIFFWRVTGENLCGEGSHSATYSFTTVGLTYLPLLVGS